MHKKKRRITINAYFNSQFSYWSLVWKMHSRTMNYEINRIHERAWKTNCQVDISTFGELLNKDNSVRFHSRNFRTFATEMFQVKNGIAPSLLEENFQIANPNCNLQNKVEFKPHNVKTLSFGTESLAFLDLKVWDNFPIYLKSLH